MKPENPMSGARETMKEKRMNRDLIWVGLAVFAFGYSVVKAVYAMHGGLDFWPWLCAAGAWLKILAMHAMEYCADADAEQAESNG